MIESILLGVLLILPPSDRYAGDLTIEHGSHGVITVAGEVGEDTSISWSRGSGGLKVSPFEGGRAVAWSGPPGDHVLRVIVVDWESRSLWQDEIAVTVRVGDDPTPGPGPDVPDPPRPPPVLDSVLAVLFYDPATVPPGVEAIPSSPVWSQFKGRATVRSFAVTEGVASEHGYTGEWIDRVRRAYGVESGPMIVYIAPNDPETGRVVAAERAESTVSTFTTVRRILGE